MPTKQELLDAYDLVRSWERVAKPLDLPKRTVWKYATDPDYEPKREDIRMKLGLPPHPRVDLIIQARNPDGTFRDRPG